MDFVFLFMVWKVPFQFQCGEVFTVSGLGKGDNQALTR
jgi:hypothetical protein